MQMPAFKDSRYMFLFFSVFISAGKIVRCFGALLFLHTIDIKSTIHVSGLVGFIIEAKVFD